ncbi:hypothetical protein GCM10023317_25840 [Actinopolymorpha pittospori]
MSNQWIHSGGGDLDVVQVAPEALWADGFGLVEVRLSLGQGVAVGVPDAADAADAGRGAGPENLVVKAIDVEVKGSRVVGYAPARR